MRTLLLLAFVTLTLTLSAQDWKAKYDKLVADKAYDSAYKLLEEVDKEKEDKQITVLKANHIIDYYASCINAKMFSLADLKEGETLEDIRSAGGQYSMYLFNIMKELDELLKNDLENPELHYALAKYLNVVITLRCGEFELSKQELMEKRYASQLLAYKAGLKDAEMMHGMGYQQMMAGNYDLAISHFIEALNMDASHASATYNLGIAKFYKQDLESALNYLKKAEQLYDDTYLQSDAIRIQGIIYREKEMNDKAEEKLAAAFELEPEYYPNVMALFDQYLNYGDTDKGYAMLNKKVLEDPAEPAKYRLILDIYGSLEKLDMLPTYMEQLAKVLPKNDATMGNYEIHYATALYYAKRPKEALVSVNKALVHFDLTPGIDASAKTSAQGLKGAIEKQLAEMGGE